MSEADDPPDMAAARWAVRLEAGPLTPERRIELDLWLAADVRHPGALARARAGLLAIDRLAALAAPAVAAGSSEHLTQSVEGPSESVEAPGGLAAPSKPLRMFDRRWGLAASLCAVIAGAVVGISFYTRADRYESGPGELRSLALVDGSQLQLDSESTATVRFSRELREVRLDRGEAMFRVAKDKQRPFVVHARGLNVRAVGTAFAVRTDPGETEVSVAEGVVEVWRDGNEQAMHRVHALERAVASEAGAVLVGGLAAEEMERDLAWRDGLVSFNGERLDVAVAQINRHSRVKLSVTDPGLAAQPIVGVFQASDAVAFSSAVSVAMGAQATRKGETIYLQPRGSDPTN